MGSADTSHNQGRGELERIQWGPYTFRDSYEQLRLLLNFAPAKHILFCSRTLEDLKKAKLTKHQEVRSLFTQLTAGIF
jgi:hypothetical protein